MNDDELRDALRHDVPRPGAGYWDRIDATLDAAADGVPTSSEDSSGEMEIPGEVIRLTDMNEQQPTSLNSSRALLAAAAVIAVIGVGAVAFAVTDRDSDPTELLVSDDSTAPLDSEAPTPATDPVPTAATVLTEVSAPAATAPPVTETTTTSTTSTSITVAPAPLPLVMPDQLRGTWRETDVSPITFDDCRIESGFERNFDRVITIRDDGFSLFETGGSLVEVHDVDATQIDATFDTTFADTPTQERLTFEVVEDATVLVRSRADEPGETRFVRCPQAPADTPDAALPLSFPDSMRGDWRESDAASVTADECREVGGFEENFGRVLRIRESDFSFFESGGDLIEVSERDDARFAALFDTTFVDTPSEAEYSFDLQDDGTVLMVQSTDLDENLQRYVRCPS